VLILELELVDAAPPEPMDLYPAMIACAGRLQSVAGLHAFLDLAVTEVRGLTGFDRVMVFQFTQDGGKIVAEDRGDDPVADLGKHFRPSDVPAPARRLFALSWLRHLPDADYVPVPLVPRIDEPVDMSVSLLRHVSVMHTGWLKNIRARAAMVMPLMKDGRLWGVMTCMHHAGPKHVAYETRTAVEFLSNMVSLQMAEQEDRDTAAYRRRMQDAVAVMVNQMTQEPEYQNGLIRGGVTLHGWMDAPGAALVTEDGVRLLGDAPTEAEVRGIAAWLQEQHDAAPVFATDRLPKLYAAAEAFKAAASGLLAARPIRSRHEFVMWFRPELVHTVNWAGDPRKPVQVTVVDGEARLTPRTSFELWKQEVRGRSAAWLDCEIEAAGALRQVMAEVVLIRLNEELRRSNSELDTFAYGASHDLKEPLRGIYNFATFLQRSADAKLTGEEAGRIQTILRLTRRMDDLTDALLQYSRIGRTDFDLEAVDLNELLRQTLDLLAPRIAETKTEIRTPHPLPALKTDARMLTGVFSELIINAMKSTDRPAGERWIEIGWRHQDGRRVFYVPDDGIGIAKQHQEQVFQIFRRLHPRDE
jgi:light-regulated signal transduction histidine kinase (bacteriophytochrome)